MKREVHNYEGVRYGVADLPAAEDSDEKGKMLQFFDPDSELTLNFPMSKSDAARLAAMLEGREIEIAKTMPADLPEVPTAPTPQ